MNTTEQVQIPSEGKAQSGWIEAVVERVNSLRFGVVQIVIHDSHVVQIEKTERLRLNTPVEH